ncbi:MAG: beta-galactosidase [Thermomicrobiales bacterium]
MPSDTGEARLDLGAAYYPEHWPPERWPEDVRLMREAGLSVVRMAEFAWSVMEPEAGRFDFEWLDSAIGLLADAGIASILGTPTAALPAWLVQQHPDVMAIDENGRRVQFGNRCHYCVTSPDFHFAARRIARAMAERFGGNTSVIGWQLDNEYNRVCYCDRCRDAFQDFLRQTFGSVDALNDAWSTRYWSQTYTDWHQIPIPIGAHNPGLVLAFRRFVTECYRRFQRLVIDELRPHLRPDVWITHNFMGWFAGFDHYVLAADLDMASWDWYIGTGHHDYLSSGAAHDLTRGFKRRNFWVMETQIGHTNHVAINDDLNKGEARAMAWHAVAHGADGLLYWQWRMAKGGQEQYWGTIVDQSGQPRPYYEEIQRLGREFGAMRSLVAGSAPVSDVAILSSYDSRWSIDAQRQHEAFDYVGHLNHYYRPLARRNIGVDVISADAPLDGYKLVIAPALLVLHQCQESQLRAFVEGGGHLVLTIRSGMKDEQGALLPTRQPGPLAELAGVEVEDYYVLRAPAPVSGPWFAGTSTMWAERLGVRGEGATTIIAQFGEANGWLDGRPAVTAHTVGKGCVYVVGAYLDDDAQKALLDHIATAAGLKPLMDTPLGVEARQRVSSDGTRIVFVINHERKEQHVHLPWPSRDHMTGTLVQNELQLEPYGIAILTRVSD